MKPYITLFFSIFYILSFSQNPNYIWKCRTANNNNSSFVRITSVDNEKVYKSNKIINLHLHILRTDNGKEGFLESEVRKWIDIVRKDYSPHNIRFRIIETSFVDNSYYYRGLNDDNFNDLIKINRSKNALNIYFLSSNDYYSRAENIPSTALVIGGVYKDTSVLSHEIGHCLGLFHTHSGSGCSDFANCKENENNCSSCGDYVCDTPTDPCLSGYVNDNCEYIGNKKFNPDTRNIMSYSSPKCLSHLSKGQAHRIHYFLEKNSELKKNSMF